VKKINHLFKKIGKNDFYTFFKRFIILTLQYQIVDLKHNTTKAKPPIE